MFTRIVVLSFQDGKGKIFRSLFDGWKEQIASFPGCAQLRLVRDKKDPDIYMTISEWKHPDDLERYRNSKLFASVWPVVKPMFKEKAQAWSVEADWDSGHSQYSEWSL